MSRGLSSIARPEAILATNTSSISITKIAAFTDRPHNVIGMHFVRWVSRSVMLSIHALFDESHLCSLSLSLSVCVCVCVDQMNPVPVMKLVEIIPGLATSKPTLTTTLQLAKYE